jgi:hypothetical protein
MKFRDKALKTVRPANGPPHQGTYEEALKGVIDGLANDIRLGTLQPYNPPKTVTPVPGVDTVPYGARPRSGGNLGGRAGRGGGRGGGSLLWWLFSFGFDDDLLYPKVREDLTSC